MSVHAELLAARAVLFDFDGPICSVFDGYPAFAVAHGLVENLRKAGISVPDQLTNESDPLAVLSWAGQSDNREILEDLDRSLTSSELIAVESALPAPYGLQVIEAVRAQGKSAAIVSNNSAQAIGKYLRWHNASVDVICGRPYANPRLMKPSPFLLDQAAKELGVPVAECLFVGDSATDMEAARAVGCPVVAYAKTDAKRQRLSAAQPTYLITSMGELLPAEATRPPSG